MTALRQTFDRWIQDHSVETEPDTRAAALRGCRSYRAWLVARALTALVVGLVLVAGLVGLRSAIAGPQDLRVTAALTLHPDRGSTPLTVTAEASASGAAPGTELEGFEFDFGDGHRVGPGQEAQTKHTYKEAGTYKVTMTVTDKQGRNAQDSREVTVTAPAATEPASIDPTARLRVRRSGVAPLAVVADGSRSEAAPGSELEGFEFDFGDGYRVGPGPEAEAEHTYQVPGLYEVTMTVTDDQGRSHRTSRKVTVTKPDDPTPSSTASR